MNGRNGRKTRATAQKRPPQWLLYVLAGCVAAFLIAQITMGVQLNGRSKQVAYVDAQIRELEAQKESLEVCLNMYQSIDRVKARAEAIGMVVPDETQIRVVSVPGFAAEELTQTAENTTAEMTYR